MRLDILLYICHGIMKETKQTVTEKDLKHAKKNSQ